MTFSTPSDDKWFDSPELVAACAAADELAAAEADVAVVSTNSPALTTSSAATTDSAEAASATQSSIWSDTDAGTDDARDAEGADDARDAECAANAATPKDDEADVATSASSSPSSSASASPERHVASPSKKRRVDAPSLDDYDDDDSSGAETWSAVEPGDLSDDDEETARNGAFSSQSLSQLKRQFLSRYSEPSQSQQPPPDACAEVASETVSQLPVVLTGLANVPCTSSGPALGLGDLIASAPARGRRPELLKCRGAARKHLKRPPFSTRLIRGRCAHRWIEDARFRTQELEDVCRFVLDDSARCDLARCDHLDAERMKKEGFDVLVVDGFKGDAQTYAKTLEGTEPLASELLNAGFGALYRSTLILFNRTDTAPPEIIAVFVACQDSEPLQCAWGKAASRSEAQVMVDRMQQYCNPTNRGKLEVQGVMFCEGLRKLRFKKPGSGACFRGDGFFGNYKHKDKCGWRGDSRYVHAVLGNAVALSSVERCYSPFMSAARLLVRTALNQPGLSVDYGDAISAPTFVASRAYACQLHRDHTADGFPESIAFIPNPTDDPSVECDFAVPVAGVVLRAKDGAFVLLQAASTTHGTLSSHHTGVGLALVTRNNLASRQAGAAFKGAHIAAPGAAAPPR